MKNQLFLEAMRELDEKLNGFIADTQKLKRQQGKMHEWDYRCKAVLDLLTGLMRNVLRHGPDFLLQEKKDRTGRNLTLCLHWEEDLVPRLQHLRDHMEINIGYMPRQPEIPVVPFRQEEVETEIQNVVHGADVRADWPQICAPHVWVVVGLIDRGTDLLHRIYRVHDPDEELTEDTAVNHPFISFPLQEKEILALLRKHLEGQQTPKDKLRPVRAAQEAGAIRRPTLKEMQRAFPEHFQMNSSSFYKYTRDDYTPYQDQAFLTLTELFRQLLS